MSSLFLTVERLRQKQRSYVRTPSDGALLCAVSLFVLLTPLLLRLNLKRLLPLIDVRTSRPARAHTYALRLEQLVDGALAGLRPLFGSYCLSRGLTLFFFLRRAGFAPTLHFGMGKVDGNFSGHCWLELEGKPFLEKTPPTLFRSVYTYVPANHAKEV